MSSDMNQLFLIRIPNTIDKKSLNGKTIDLSGRTQDIDGSDVCYECDDKQSEEVINLIKLSQNELKVDKTSTLCGYIQLRVKPKVTTDCHPLTPLAKRHVVEPIDHFIESKTNPKLRHKKQKRKK